MRSRLSATHLLQHIVLFCLVSFFILTISRGSYVLWQYPKVVEAKALFSVFATGTRFDLALIGMLILPTLLLGGVFGLFESTRKCAKFSVLFLLMFGLIFILLSELVTPYFLTEQGARPDWQALSSISHPSATIAELWSTYFLPMLIALAIVVLIIVAYVQRLTPKRLLRARLRPLSTFVLIVVGTGLCLLSIFSSTDFSKPPLSPSAALISTDRIVNEIALNSGFKLLYYLH